MESYGDSIKLKYESQHTDKTLEAFTSQGTKSKFSLGVGKIKNNIEGFNPISPKRD